MQPCDGPCLVRSPLLSFAKSEEDDPVKFLVVSPYVPHPKARHGTGVFLYGLLTHLSRKHDITLLTFAEEAEQVLVADLQRENLRVVVIPRPKGFRGPPSRRALLLLQRLVQMGGSIIRWEPYYVSKYRHRAMADAVRRLTEAERFDIVQLEFTFMGSYADASRSGAIVLRECDVSYRPAYRRYRHATSFLQRWLEYVEWCRWYRYETRLVRGSNHVLTVTEQDRRLLEWLTGSTRISYLPSGMEMPGFLPPFDRRVPETILFIGTFLHHPNADAATWLVREIFPRVVQHHPGAVLHIVGDGPPGSFRELASHQPGIRVHGFVPNVEQYLGTCSVFLAPLRFGGGVKIKILHAMAHGIPVVTTKVGIEGIEGFQPGMARLGRDADELARHVCALFRDKSQAEAMAVAARESVARTLSWTALEHRVEDIYRRAADAAPQAGPGKKQGKEHEE